MLFEKPCKERLEIAFQIDFMLKLEEEFSTYLYDEKASRWITSENRKALKDQLLENKDLMKLKEVLIIFNKQFPVTEMLVRQEDEEIDELKAKKQKKEEEEKNNQDEEANQNSEAGDQPNGKVSNEISAKISQKSKEDGQNSDLSEDILIGQQKKYFFSSHDPLGARLNHSQQKNFRSWEPKSSRITFLDAKNFLVIFLGRFSQNFWRKNIFDLTVQ